MIYPVNVTQTRLLVLGLACLPLSVDGADITHPITTANTLPISNGSGLSSPLSANLQTDETWIVALSSSVQSHANDAGSNSEDLIIDAEIYSLVAALKFNFAKDWQLGLQLEGQRHSPGNLDSAIDKWHDFFNLDNGDRNEQSRDQLLIRYRSQVAGAEVRESQSGLKDALITLSHQALDLPSLQLSVHGQLNLPSGSSAQLYGSEKLDAALSVSVASNNDTLGWHANIGALRLGDASLFGIPTRQSTWFSSLGAHWQASEQWRWSAQLDGHGSIFRSSIDEINQPVWLFSVAGERSLWPQGPTVQLYFSEDVSVNRAADFSLGLTINFD